MFFRGRVTEVGEMETQTETRPVADETTQTDAEENDSALASSSSAASNVSSGSAKTKSTVENGYALNGVYERAGVYPAEDQVKKGLVAVSRFAAAKASECGHSFMLRQITAAETRRSKPPGRSQRFAKYQKHVEEYLRQKNLAKEASSDVKMLIWELEFNGCLDGARELQEAFNGVRNHAVDSFSIV